MSIMSILRRLEMDVGELVEHHEGKQDLRDFERYENDPLGFIGDVLGLTPWAKQKDMAHTVLAHPLVAVVGANGTGKDWMLAALSLWWVYARKGKVLITAPTERQLREVLFGEIGKAWHGVSDLPGELFTQVLRLGPESGAGILGFTSTQVSRLTGFHEERVLAILSEAQGLEPFVLEGMMSCAGGSEDRIILAGNPIYPTGFFHHSAHREEWATVTIPAADHPNILEGKTVIPGGPSREGIERLKSQYGADSNTYRSRVLSEFPTQDDEGLFDRDWIDAAVDRFERKVFKPEGEPIASLDVARYGSDGNCLMVRHGPNIVHIEKWGGLGVLNTAEKVHSIVQTFGIRPKPCAPLLPPKRGRVVVDVCGPGPGTAERLKQLGYDVNEFNGGASMSGRFLNKRAEAFWALRDRLSQDGDISFPYDEELIEELLAIRWREGSGGRIQIGEKTEIRARIGRSPDKADALSMAFLPEKVGAKTFRWRV